MIDIKVNDAVASARRVAIVIGGQYAYERGELRGILDYARGHSDWEVLSGTPEDSTWQAVAAWAPDGIISSAFHLPLAQQVRELGVPVVETLKSRAPKECPRVTDDGVGAGRVAARYLMDQGFRTFGCIGVRDAVFSQRREEGFIDELRKAGLSCACYRVPFDADLQRYQSRLLPLKADLGSWLAALPKPACILGVNDGWGRMIAQNCLAVGLTVPSEIAVLGIDNDELWCQMSDPELSSVVIPWRLIGLKAAELLDRLMQGEQPPRTPILVGPIGVETRFSTSTLAISDPDIREALQFIQEHACRGINVEDVLRMVPIDRRRIERRFLALLGRTPYQQILRVRIERAKRLLAETDIPITLVAQRCGFSPKQFSVTFTHVVGTNPQFYRREYRHSGMSSALPRSS